MHSSSRERRDRVRVRDTMIRNTMYGSRHDMGIPKIMFPKPPFNNPCFDLRRITEIIDKGRGRVHVQIPMSMHIPVTVSHHVSLLIQRVDGDHMGI